MHELVSRIKAPELCYVFVKNAPRNGHPDVALQAHRHAVEAAYQEAFAAAAWAQTVPYFTWPWPVFLPPLPSLCITTVFN